MAKILPAGHHHGTFLKKWSSCTHMVCRIEYPGRSTYGEHGNERASVVFIEKGVHIKRFGRSVLHLGPGSMLLIPPSYLQVDHFESNTIVLAAEIPTNLLKELCNHGVVLHDHIQIANSDALLIRDRLRRELLEADDLSGMIFEGIFAELVIHSARRSWRKEKSPASRMLQVRDLLHDCVFDSPRLREIAAAVDIQPSRLSRDFRRCFGTTPGEYLRRLRLEHATREIEETTKSLAEIAAASGFADQAHLSRAFKRYKGFSPSRHRRAATSR